MLGDLGIPLSPEPVVFTDLLNIGQATVAFAFIVRIAIVGVLILHNTRLGPPLALGIAVLVFTIFERLRIVEHQFGQWRPMNLPDSALANDWVLPALQFFFDNVSVEAVLLNIQIRRPARPVSFQLSPGGCFFLS